jgi:Kef-type K+ transport system membrane component KefB
MIDQPIPTLDRIGLRNFGFTTGAIVIVLFGLLLPWLFSFNWPTWPWILAAVFFILAFAAPMALNPIYKVWMRFGMIMGWINTRIILFIIFFGIFFVVALIMKVFGRDSMSRRIDRDSASYRVSSTPQAKEHLEKPY